MKLLISGMLLNSLEYQYSASFNPTELNLNNLNESQEVKSLNQSIDKEHERLINENKKLKRMNKLLKSQGRANKIPVLMYHHLLEGKDLVPSGFDNNASVLSVEAFEEQMKYLYEHDFYIASIEELEDFINGFIDLPKKTVVITFDDGYLSNAKYAYPILKKYNFNATIFMIGKWIAQTSPVFDITSLNFMSLEDMKNCSDIFAYGNHTYDLHRIIEKQSAVIVASKDDLVKDFQRNRELINFNYFTYPYGKYDEETITALIETNHRIAFTIEREYVSKSSNKYLLPRFGIYPSTNISEFERIVNGF